jgi:hypothetical protein
MNLSNLETANWTREWDTSINPNKSDLYDIVPTPAGLKIYNAGVKFSGQLAKNVSAYTSRPAQITFNYVLTIDEWTERYGQVVETDSPFTDSDGWTYPNDFQFNIASGWMTQTGNPWFDTGWKAPVPRAGIPYPVSIVRAIDYAKHTTDLVSVMAGGEKGTINVKPINGSQRGWGRSEMVTQLQLCTNSSAYGAYSVLFSGIGYSG